MGNFSESWRSLVSGVFSASWGPGAGVSLSSEKRLELRQEAEVSHMAGPEKQRRPSEANPSDLLL